VTDSGDNRTTMKKISANPANNSDAILVARAVDESAGGDPVLFHGYYFRELPTRPTNGLRGGSAGNTNGGSRSSGVMTFVVTDSDMVFEKDLGNNTKALASAMTGFHKNGTWHAAHE
jgi:hypothetical protein